MSVFPNPHVGQPVHYRSLGSANGKFEPACRAAMITAVLSVRTVSLAVSNPTGLFFDTEVIRGERRGEWHYIGDPGCYLHTDEEVKEDR